MDTIKNIPLSTVLLEYLKIKLLTEDEIESLPDKSKLGCNIIDYYFFQERLDTIGNKGINFHQFMNEYNDKYSNKPYIQNLIAHCDRKKIHTTNVFKRFYLIYTFCFGSINSFKITNALHIYYKYKPFSILDFCCGWGGRCIASMIYDCSYFGIDTNLNLFEGYEKLQQDLTHKNNISILFRDANKVDYSTIFYDLVLTSPPYYNIELYNGTMKKKKFEWNQWYYQVFRKTYDGLSINGHYCLNVNDDIYYNVCIEMLGQATTIIPLKMASKNKYTENIYVWKKTA